MVVPRTGYRGVMPEENAAIEADERTSSFGGDAASVETAPDAAPTEGERDADPSDEEKADGPGWWHRSHPTFAALTGFYAGLLFVILFLGVAGLVLAWIFGQDKAEQYSPWLLLTLLVPLAMLVPRKTRRFAEFVWVGIVSTIVVVVGVGWLVLWLMINHTG